MKRIIIIFFLSVFTIHIFAQNTGEDLIDYYYKNEDDVGKSEQELFNTLKDYCEGDEKSFFVLINSLPSYNKVSDEEISKVLPLGPNTFIRILYSKDNIILLCYITNKDEDYSNNFMYHLDEYKKILNSFGTPLIENDKGLIEKKDAKIAGIDSDWIIKNYRIRYNDTFYEMTNGSIHTTGPVVYIESKDKNTDLKPLLTLRFECTKSYYIIDGEKENADFDEPINKFIIDFNKKILYNSDYQYIASITKSNESEIVCEGKNGNVVYTYKIDRQLGTYTYHSERINKTPKAELYEFGIVSLITKSLF